MASKEETFVPGEWVVWDDNVEPIFKDAHQKLRNELGEGPFLVASVADEPRRLHPQMVHIEYEVNEKKHTMDFSGYFLKHIRQ